MFKNSVHSGPEWERRPHTKILKRGLPVETPHAGSTHLNLLPPPRLHRNMINIRLKGSRTLDVDITFYVPTKDTPLSRNALKGLLQSCDAGRNTSQPI